ncbi:ATP synthase mitochondrial F1 complex assembly factor 1 [Tetranychus urticae]|nr:ATP synthase mitochondrial F1 complex assembly factor 1 [Tetranychus urticae]
MFRMMLPNLIKKEIRKNTFSLPYSWSLQDHLCRSLKDDASTTKSSLPTASSSTNILKDSEGIETNPFYNKYADKIKKVVNNEGIKIAEKIEKNLEEIATLNKIPESQRVATKTKKSKDPKEVGPKIGGFPGNRTLKDIVNLEMLLKLDADSISEVWSEYHRLKSKCIYAVIPGEKYKTIYETGKKYPLFIFPVPKTESSTGDDKNNDQSGYQIYLGSFNYHQIHFTPLISYHAHQENAPAAMTLRHYPEISEEKGIVLMEGYYDDKILNSMEAQCLANQVQIFYGANDLTKNLLLNKFNKDPKSFDYNEVIDQFEKGLL